MIDNFVAVVVKGVFAHYLFKYLLVLRLISCVTLKRLRQQASGSIVVSGECFSGVLMAMLFEVMNRYGAGLPGPSLCNLHGALWFHEAPSFQSSRHQLGSSFTPHCSTFP